MFENLNHFSNAISFSISVQKFKNSYACFASELQYELRRAEAHDKTFQEEIQYKLLLSRFTFLSYYATK